jgi:multidrug efflux pump
VSIVGGLIISQLLTLYTTPVVYLYMDRFSLWLNARWSALFPGRASASGTAQGGVAAE